MTIRRLRIARCSPQATNTHSPYVIITAPPQQQWLHERASLLRYTYIACLVLIYVFQTVWHFTYSWTCRILQEQFGLWLHSARLCVFSYNFWRSGCLINYKEAQRFGILLCFRLQTRKPRVFKSTNRQIMSWRNILVQSEIRTGRLLCPMSAPHTPITSRGNVIVGWLSTHFSSSYERKGAPMVRFCLGNSEPCPLVGRPF